MIDSAKYQAQASELSQKLWAIANDLRGNMDSTKFRNYILGTIFYRYLSERTKDYMQEILKEDGLTYEQAFADDDYRPVVEQWSIEHLGYIIRPENLFGELVRRIVRPDGDADRFNVEDYERAVNELIGSTMGQASEAAFSGLFNDMKLQDPDLGDTVAARTSLIAKVIVKISEIDLKLADSQFDVLGTAYMILIGLFASDAGKKSGEFFTPTGPSKLVATLATVGLDEARNKKVGHYSLGMKQRLGIAQAIMEQRPYLILDEPMNSLDESAVEIVRNLILTQKAKGVTVLIASHYKEDIEMLCDTVTLLKDGKIGNS